MRKAILLFPLALAACGGSAMSSGPAVVSLQAAGASPSAISVIGGTPLIIVQMSGVGNPYGP